MTEREKMIQGAFYDPSDPELMDLRNAARAFTTEFNRIGNHDHANQPLLHSFLKNANKPYMEAPFYCDYGTNIFIGENFFANFECILLDCCPITIGDNCMFGPRVSLYTATHPLKAAERNSGLEYGKPITIGNNVWLCGNVVINPGVTIGNNVVVASGSLVIHDVPDNVLVAGNPAKVIQTIEE